MINQETFTFLKNLKNNNHRDWFQENKATYQIAHEDVINFADSLYGEMQQHDNIVQTTGKKSLHRIYRDIRFSKDKTPYKSNFSGGFKRATKALRGGYYYHIEPGNTFIGGGFWGPNSEDLKLIRSHIAAEPERLREIIKSKDFIKHFGQLDGAQVKTAPKGYSKEDPAIELLRYKQFLIGKSFDDKDAMKKGFPKQVSDTFYAMRPFFNYMSEILTTDLNGIPLI